jgi:hypothetical protein
VSEVSVAGKSAFHQPIRPASNGMIVVRSTGKSIPKTQRIKRTWSWLRCYFAFRDFTLPTELAVPP